jgi:hypothetical protein
MAQNRVEIDNPAEDRITLHLSGPQFRSVNEGMLHECVSALLQCAEDNQCFERGLTVACLGTVATHNAETRCCGQAFGIAGA